LGSLIALDRLPHLLLSLVVGRTLVSLIAIDRLPHGLLSLVVGCVWVYQTRQFDAQYTVVLDAIAQLLDVQPLGQNELTSQILVAETLKFVSSCHHVLGLHNEKTLLLLEVDVHFFDTKSDGVDVKHHLPFAGGFISNTFGFHGAVEGVFLQQTQVFLNRVFVHLGNRGLWSLELLEVLELRASLELLELMALSRFAGEVTESHWNGIELSVQLLRDATDLVGRLHQELTTWSDLHAQFVEVDVLGQRNNSLQFVVFLLLQFIGFGDTSVGEDKHVVHRVHLNLQVLWTNLWNIQHHAELALDTGVLALVSALTTLLREELLLALVLLRVTAAALAAAQLLEFGLLSCLLVTDELIQVFVFHCSTVGE